MYKRQGVHHCGKSVIIFQYNGSSKLGRLTEYAEPAREVIEDNGFRFVVCGLPKSIYEDGHNKPTIVIEFESVKQAMAAYESVDYQAARKLLGSVSHDFRIVEQSD